MMGNIQHLSRRGFNAFLAGAVAWPCSGEASPLTNQGCIHQKIGQDILVSLFENPRNARAIGAACLKSLPPNSPQQLTRAILAAAECDAETIKATHAVRQRISNRVRKDFAEDAVVSVDGWMLSLTEARLYALVALSVESEP